MLTFDEIKDKYFITDEINSYLNDNTKKSLTTKTWTKKNKHAYDRLLDHRIYLIETVFRGDPQSNITYPVHIQRIVENITLRKGKKKVNISPAAILKGNDILKNKLYVNHVFKNNTLMNILIDIHLHPKVLIQKYSISKNEYNIIVSEI